MQEENVKTKKKIVRVSGRLRELVTVEDEKGNILHKILSPVMIEFYPRDVMQVIVGSTILAIPVAFTEETWKLGQSLPMLHVVGLLILSLLFISSFVYYNFYRNVLKEHKKEYFKRIISIYCISFMVVTAILLLIQIAPWSTDWVLAFKRTVLVTFPASMSAAVSDMIK